MANDMGSSKAGGHQAPIYEGADSQGGKPTEAGTVETPGKQNAAMNFTAPSGYPGTKAGAH